MNKLVICSIFTAFALAMVMPSAFADHEKIDINISSGSASPGCEADSSCFSPSEATIDLGGEVTWQNDDTAAHTVTGGDPASGPNNTFDSGIFMAGKTFSYKFETEGEFPYFCQVHPWMQGKVIVQANAEESGSSEHEESKSYFTHASADGSIIVKVGSGKPTNGEALSLDVEFTNPDGNAIEHVNYDIVAIQEGIEVLSETGKHAMSGTDTLTTAVLESESPVDVNITILGIGPEDDKANWSGPSGEIVSLQVVPEFGPVAIAILAAAIVSIVAISTRSKVIPKL